MGVGFAELIADSFAELPETGDHSLMQLSGEAFGLGRAFGELCLLKRTQPLSVGTGDRERSGALRGRLRWSLQLGTQRNDLKASKQPYQVSQIAGIRLIEGLEIGASLRAVDDQRRVPRPK